MTLWRIAAPTNAPRPMHPAMLPLSSLTPFHQDCPIGFHTRSSRANTSCRRQHPEECTASGLEDTSRAEPSQTSRLWRVEHVDYGKLLGCVNGTRLASASMDG